MLKKFLRDITLLFDSPKDFIYSFTYSNTEKVVLKKYDPKVQGAARTMISKLKKLSPGVRYYLVGSTALKIGGFGDIDIFATTKGKLGLATDNLSVLAGVPSKTRKGFTEWKFEFQGFDVELFLTHPENKHFQENIRLLGLLKKHKKEYDDFKKQLNGCSRREYVRARMGFFNGMLKVGNR